MSDFGQSIGYKAGIYKKTTETRRHRDKREGAEKRLIAERGTGGLYKDLNQKEMARCIRFFSLESC